MDAVSGYFHSLHHNMDWWMAISVGTLGLRAAVTLPLALIARRRMHRYQIMQPLLESTRNTLKVQLDRGSINKQEYRTQLREHRSDLYKTYKCRPQYTIAMQLTQIPLFLVVAGTLRQMAGYPFLWLERTQPIPGLDEGGLLWLDNLTIPDPTLITPIILGCLHWHNFSHAKGAWSLVLKSMAILSVPISTMLPSSIMIYWLTSACFSAAQHFLIPQLDKYFPAVK
ncbi:membrane insertase OXA1/ALB3/YidC [Gorgonomyces haynaldii]|nr:membrane insertase OXA1/ALB3/YidC [Gorgonomyces haynaldii]